jgi:hypothetical protein
LSQDIEEKIEGIAVTAKKGFDLQARLKGRGLRRASITLFLDEEKGVELGWARDVKDGLGNTLGVDRSGVLGDLDLAVANLAATEVLAKGPKAADVKQAQQRVAELEARRDELVAELTKSGLVIQMRAVPPVIQKDCRRRAKDTLNITAKNVPDEIMEEFSVSNTAHLMTVMFQSITDNESGEVSDSVSYDDAISLIEYLPTGQMSRLDVLMGEVQFTDAISESIESQEDFS